MPAVGNMVTVRYVSQLGGVQMGNQVQYRIDALGATPTSAQLLDELATAYAIAVQDLVTAAWELVCLVYDNVTVFEAQQILFVSNPGIAAGDSHPTNQVLRFNRWGQIEAGDEQYIVSSFSQSGVAESFSTRGRLNDAAIAVDMQNFLCVQQILPTFGTVSPYVHGLVVPAIPGPPVEGDQKCVQSQVNDQFLKLASRKSSLCS